MIPEKEKLELSESLRLLMQPNEKNIGKQLFQLKRLFDEWALSNLEADGFPSIRLAHIPVLMNIGHGGITNKELASRIHISKQAMSKTLREVKSMDLIEESPHPDDARSNILILTYRGLQLVVFVRKRVKELSEKYAARVGEDRYRTFLEVMGELVRLHQQGIE